MFHACKLLPPGIQEAHWPERAIEKPEEYRQKVCHQTVELFEGHNIQSSNRDNTASMPGKLGDEHIWEAEEAGLRRQISDNKPGSDQRPLEVYSW